MQQAQLIREKEIEKKHLDMLKNIQNELVRHLNNGATSIEVVMNMMFLFHIPGKIKKILLDHLPNH